MVARIAGAAMLIAFTFFARPASARPVAYYNPVTGNLRLFNDTRTRWSYGYEWLTFISHSELAFVTDLGAYVPPAGPKGVVHTDELPTALHYLHVPLGWSDFGNVIVPGTPASDLSAPGKQTTEGPLPVRT